MTAVPLALSRLSMMSTLTPCVSMLSAMVWNVDGSPWAFWMVALTLAALNAAVRFGRSWVSYRADDFVSGRITPTKGCLAFEVVPLPLGLFLLELPQAAM